MEKQELEQWLNSLVGSELIASLQYEFASHIVKGTDWDTCNSEFEQHAQEEREHMNKLIDCMVERDLIVNTELISLINNAKPIYENMLVLDSNGLVQFHFKAEESAIKTYREFYNLIKEEDITLADEIKSILEDEIEHRKDLKKIYSSISDGESLINDENIYTNFSKLTEKLNDINFGFVSDTLSGVGKLAGKVGNIAQGTLQVGSDILNGKNPTKRYKKQLSKDEYRSVARDLFEQALTNNLTQRDFQLVAKLVLKEYEEHNK